MGTVVGACSLRMDAIWRRVRMRRTALGPAIAMRLEVPAVAHVMLHPDGRFWVDRLTEGLADTSERLVGHSMESADCPTIGHGSASTAPLFLISFAGGVDG